MDLLALLLALVAAGVFALAAFSTRTYRVALVPLGLMLLTLALICQFVGITHPVG